LLSFSDHILKDYTNRDDDIQKLKDQKEEMAALMSSVKSMQLRIESYEHSQAQVMEELR
jgi:hypothetical protein